MDQLEIEEEVDSAGLGSKAYKSLEEHKDDVISASYPVRVSWKAWKEHNPMLCVTAWRISLPLNPCIRK